MNRMRLTTILALALGLAALGWAQDQTTSSKVRPSDNTNAQGNVLGDRPNAVLKIEKIKGAIEKIDLEGRTVTVAGKKKGQELTLTFSQPAGREQIKVGKKAAEKLGKKRVELEELTVGQQVEGQYYPNLGQLLELVVL